MILATHVTQARGVIDTINIVQAMHQARACIPMMSLYVAPRVPETALAYAMHMHYALAPLEHIRHNIVVANSMAVHTAMHTVFQLANTAFALCGSGRHLALRTQPVPASAARIDREHSLRMLYRAHRAMHQVQRMFASVWNDNRSTCELTQFLGKYMPEPRKDMALINHMIRTMFDQFRCEWDVELAVRTNNDVVFLYEYVDA